MRSCRSARQSSFFLLENRSHKTRIFPPAIKHIKHFEFIKKCQKKKKKILSSIIKTLVINNFFITGCFFFVVFFM